jgi:nucleoside 2-deoxyribosyltransferase
MKSTYSEAIEPAIRDDAGYNCIRIDAKEYNGAIMDQIKAEIRQSRFVVADLTNHSNGVYFESGFADGLGIPVIWTCSDEHADKTHFDTKHLNQIRWATHAELRERLANRIKATIGVGPLKPRPAVSS